MKNIKKIFCLPVLFLSFYFPIIAQQIPPQDIINIIQLIGGIELLQEPVFLHTNPLNRRSILDMPLFSRIAHLLPQETECNTHVFYTLMHRGKFTKYSSQLSSYIALEQNSLIEKLENIIGTVQTFQPEFELDINLIFSLLAPISVEERNAGFMLDFTHHFERSLLRIILPLYYFERNFFLEDDKKEALARELGITSDENEEEFRKQHFVSDKFGIGDTRLEYSYQFYTDPSLSFQAGLFVTLPTAWQWTHGFKGSLFDRPSTFPTVNLDELIALALNPTLENQKKAFDTLVALSLDAFDRVAANLLDDPLGNKRHTGIGVFELTTTQLGEWLDYWWTHHIQLDSRISVEYLFAHNEKRFYTTQIDTAAFAQRNFNDPDQAEDNLQFLTDQLIERYFLRAFTTKVRPGIIFHYTSQLRYQHDCWQIRLGSDFWVQEHEKIASVERPSIAPNLDIKKVIAPIAYQSGIFGNVNYLFITDSGTPINLGLEAQATFGSKGIGSSWGLGLFVQTRF